MKRLLLAVGLSGAVALGAATVGAQAAHQHAVSAAKHKAISIKGFAFAPKKVTVHVGTVITWTNNDSAAHTVTSDTGSKLKLDSSTLNTGDTYKVTVKKTGTFKYHCNFHPFMHGTIKVIK
jgi:plastocyanin